MIPSIFSIIFILFFSIVPLLIWGYGNIYLSEHAWNRARFLAGIIGGIASIACILFFKKGLHSTGYGQIGAVIGVFIVLGGVTWRVISYGSIFIRGFLRRTLLLHIGIFSVFLYGWGFFREYVPMNSENLSFFAGIGGFFIAACLEEGVKHVSSLGLTARNFRFSRQDLLLFTFFVTLGFVSGENLLYLVDAYKNGTTVVLMTGVYRLLFALPLHVFAASICVMLWWKALSYRFSSWRYSFLFLSGYVLAAGVHTFYNFLIEKKMFILLVLIAGIGYMAFTQWIIPKEEGEKIRENGLS